MILVVAGLASLTAAGYIALHSFDVRVSGRVYACGNVLLAKDPRNRVSARRASVPVVLTRAYRRCEKIRTDRTHRSTNFMILGAVPLLFVLALPALTRRSRRARSHRRMRM